MAFVLHHTSIYIYVYMIVCIVYTVVYRLCVHRPCTSRSRDAARDAGRRRARGATRSRAIVDGTSARPSSGRASSRTRARGDGERLGTRTWINASFTTAETSIGELTTTRGRGDAASRRVMTSTSRASSAVVFPGALRAMERRGGDGREAREDVERRSASLAPMWATARERAIDDELDARERGGTGSAEVYVVSRPFQEWGKGIFSALPNGARQALLTAGVAHFMLVYKDLKTGQMQQFDFGPVGGDVHDRLFALTGGKTYRSSERGARDTVYAMTRGSAQKQHKARRKSSCVQGDIRETSLRTLPKNAFLVGTTHLSLDDIKNFNDARDTMYELHVNDCRHYLNDLSYYLTRESAACSRFVNYSIMRRLEEKKGQFWEHHMWLTKALADVENVSHWNKAGRFAGATLMFGMGTRFMPFVPAKRLVTWGSGVVAGTSDNVPVVREVLNFGGFLLDSGRSVLQFVFTAQHTIRKNVTRGVESHILNAKARARPPMSRSAKLARASKSSNEDLSTPRAGVRVSSSIVIVPGVAITMGNTARKAFPKFPVEAAQNMFQAIGNRAASLRANLSDAAQRFNERDKVRA